jgi:hypothetical protein
MRKYHEFFLPILAITLLIILFLLPSPNATSLFGVLLLVVLIIFLLWLPFPHTMTQLLLTGYLHFLLFFSELAEIPALSQAQLECFQEDLLRELFPE